MDLFDPGTPTPEENLTILLKKDGLRIERIVSWHHTTPENFWYNQDEDEWLVLLEGNAVLHYDPAQQVNAPVTQPLQKGTPFFIPAHRRHQVTHTSAPAIWLCVFHCPTPH